MYIKKPDEYSLDIALKPDERRTIKRRHLIYYLRVWNRENQELLGHVVDITTEGFMLISEEPLPIGENVDIEIRLPNSKGDVKPLDFKGVCRWSKKDINTDFYDTGFEFTDSDEEDIETIQSLIMEYGFDD